MKLLTAIAALILFTFGFSANSKAATCEELNKSWLTRYYYDFKVKWPHLGFECPSPQSAIANAYYELDYLRWTAPAEHGAPPDFYHWISHLIKQTAYTPVEPTTPWSTANADQSGLMTFHNNFFDKNEAPEWQVSVLVHEARHIQKGDPSHVVCSHGLYFGKKGCDATLLPENKLLTGSGYNYGFYFLWWLRDGAKRTNLDKAVAGIMLKATVLNNFESVSNEQVRKWAN